MDLSKQIREAFADVSTYKDKSRSRLFGGRRLPAFVQEYLLMRFSNKSGVIDEEALKEYLDTKMTTDSGEIRRRLLAGEKVKKTVLTPAVCITKENVDDWYDPTSAF